MTDSVKEQVLKHPTDRASTGRRLLTIVMGGMMASGAAASPWLVPDRCLWVGWAFFALMFSVGCLTVFFGARGRQADLKDCSPQDLAIEFAGEMVAAAILAVVIGLLSIYTLNGRF